VDNTARAVWEAVRAIAEPDTLLTALGPRRAATLHDGLPGTALLLAALSAADASLTQAAVRHWEVAATLLGGAAPDGIHRGPGALAASLIIGNGYLADHVDRNAVGSAAAWLSARARVLARRQETRSKNGTPGTPWGRTTPSRA
jgi:hypothetical protein